MSLQVGDDFQYSFIPSLQFNIDPVQPPPLKLNIQIPQKLRQLWGGGYIFRGPVFFKVYHLESRWLATPMYWFIMAPYKATFWELRHLLSLWCILSMIFGCSFIRHVGEGSGIFPCHGRFEFWQNPCWLTEPRVVFHTPTKTQLHSRTIWQMKTKYESNLIIYLNFWG